MQRIVAPILANDHGPAVRNLQDGLILFLAKDVVGSERQALIDMLAAEQPDAVYGTPTTRCLSQLSTESKLFPPSNHRRSR